LHLKGHTKTSRFLLTPKKGQIWQSYNKWSGWWLRYYILWKRA